MPAGVWERAVKLVHTENNQRQEEGRYTKGSQDSGLEKEESTEVVIVSERLSEVGSDTRFGWITIIILENKVVLFPVYERDMEVCGSLTALP